MLLEFPKDFIWGTATSAAQTETAFDHQFKGLEASDGFFLERTIDHEQRRESDLKYISQLGNLYRCGVDWSRLQRAPYASFDPEVATEYRDFFRRLNEAGVDVMLVLHHFAHPNWFEAAGGWTWERNVPYFIDFARRCQEQFGEFVRYWNTFNEPNAYAVMAYLLGKFPPFRRRRLMTAQRALRNMGIAHDVVYEVFKNTRPAVPVGIAHSVAMFEGSNVFGKLPAMLCHWWYNYYSARPFRNSDFWGINYYAYIPFDPLPVTEIDRPGRLEKLGIDHDDMWGRNPEGLNFFLRRFYAKYGKPVIVTESGICTDDPDRRIELIREDLKTCHRLIQEGVDLRGYIHWSTFDNFEWHLGPSFRFGLVHVNLYNKERTMTKAGQFYHELTTANAVRI